MWLNYITHVREDKWPLSLSNGLWVPHKPLNLACMNGVWIVNPKHPIQLTTFTYWHKKGHPSLTPRVSMTSCNMPLDANSVLKEIVKFWRWINHDTSVNLVSKRLWFLHWNGLPVKGKGACITAKWGIRYFKFHDDPDNTFAVIPSDSLQWNISAIYSYCEWPKPLTLGQKCCARNVENEGLPGLSQR